ncbi:DUF2268 domain-containing protein [Caldibacillus lycopersici]|uniref:DUF2268 domain-containing protein n=1 Tax=Perspicuibacillus lycopersici TaxID=1325689 RepID=A0AAE3IUK4_9BACI|nr:DUF2268 domain-containing protein [Perspicuibacillus lycopersici]MCU9612345.1 DUF2268 domain-containing protein [Perspicuibacillus lycopersici]
MTIINTDQWILEMDSDPIEIFMKIEHYFPETTAFDIYQYFIQYGMTPFLEEKERIILMQEKKIWDIVQQEEHVLQKQWDGPNIPIFIFPSDHLNSQLVMEHNGMSGIAFQDKLFLFIAEHQTEKEIRSLFTHEYSHVCRLKSYPKNQQDYVLLDTIILEGIAEYAVYERHGLDGLSNWTNRYNKDQLKNMWEQIVLPNKNIPIHDHKHQHLLYGLHSYPSMLGYCVGFYLVRNYAEARNLSCKELHQMNSQCIALRE